MLIYKQNLNLQTVVVILIKRVNQVPLIGKASGLFQLHSF
jgi:hypothetical protein